VTTHTTNADRQETIERGAEARDDGRPLSTADISEGRQPADETEVEKTDVEKTEVDKTEAATRVEQPAPETDNGSRRAAPLFADDAATDLRDRWTEVQTGFVDEPRKAVEQADALVAEVMKRLADSFATERQALEQQWSRGDDVSTEELRISLRRYRSFFDRLLSV
jgi:hypothetical protein